jgi:hypothetical protein
VEEVRTVDIENSHPNYHGHIIAVLFGVLAALTTAIGLHQAADPTTTGHIPPRDHGLAYTYRPVSRDATRPPLGNCR